MVTINPEVLAEHALDVRAFAEKAHSAASTVNHECGITDHDFGLVGLILVGYIHGMQNSYYAMTDALANKADLVQASILQTAKLHNFSEEANKKLMENTKLSVTDPDFFHMPKAASDIPDMGPYSSGIAQFAQDYPELAKAGDWALVLGWAGTALDVLGMALDPVGTVFGALAGVIIDLIPPFKFFLDLLMGNPGAIKTSSEAWDEIARFMAEASAELAKSVASVTEHVWDEPPASVNYKAAAKALVDTAQSSGAHAETISQNMICAASAIADVRAIVFGQIVGWVVDSLIEATLAAESAPVTFGASLVVAAGLIETEAAFKLAIIVDQVAALAARLGAAGIVAHHQGEEYQKFVDKLNS